MTKKITEKQMLTRLRVGETLLLPLVIDHSDFDLRHGKSGRQVDAVVEAALPNDGGRFRFVVETKARPTLEAIHAAASQAKAATGTNEWPMIQVPFLAPDRLKYLEDVQVSGVDLCGNGVVIIPRRLLVIRSGQPNRYHDSRPLNNPYRGRSAMVARMMIANRFCRSLKELVERISNAGLKLSLAQASKAVRALEEEMLVLKVRKTIQLTEPDRLLGKLGLEWRSAPFHIQQSFRLNSNDTDWSTRLSSDPALQWAVTGESSATHYTAFAQGGPKRIAVSSLARAASLLNGIPERVSNFADIELLETEEPGYFFQTQTDGNGMRWASRLQTWLELQAGDGRQQEAARDLRAQILGGQK